MNQMEKNQSNSNRYNLLKKTSSSKKLHSKFGQIALNKLKKADSERVLSLSPRSNPGYSPIGKSPVKSYLNEVHWKSSGLKIEENNAKYERHLGGAHPHIQYFSTPKFDINSINLYESKNGRNCDSRNQLASYNTPNIQNLGEDKRFVFQTAVSQFDKIPNNKPLSCHADTQKAPGFITNLDPSLFTNKGIIPSKDRENLRVFSLRQSRETSLSNTEIPKEINLETHQAKQQNIKPLNILPYKMFAQKNLIAPQIPPRKVQIEKEKALKFPECHYFENRIKNKQKRIKKVLNNIRVDRKDRRNIDIEQFMELRSNFSEKLAVKDTNKKVELTQEQMAFGIEILPDGSKQFKMYDKVMLSFSNPFEVCCLLPEKRTPNDNLYLAHYLFNNIKYFSGMNLTLIAFISRKITAK